MNKLWLLLALLVGCVKPQQSALQSCGIDLWAEMENYMLQNSRKHLQGIVEVVGSGETALATVRGTDMDLALLLKELLTRAQLPHLYDLCEPTGTVSVNLEPMALGKALPIILEHAGYRCVKRGAGENAVWVIADGGPSSVANASIARTYRQFTPNRITASSLKDNLLLGSAKTAALWPQGNSTGLTVGMSPEANRIFLTGPQADVARTLQILQKADQQTPHILLDCIMIFLKESEVQQLYAKLDLSGGPLFLKGLGNDLQPPFGSTFVAASGMINADVLSTMDQPFRIGSAVNTTTNAPDLKALLQNIENRQVVRAQLLVQSGQQASLQIGRNGYLLLTTFSEGQPSVQTQQINAGSTLTLTPRALPNDMIRVDANLQIARFEDSITATIKANVLSFQTINTVQVRDGEPVMLGGGVISYGVRTRQGYPVGRQIPILDYLANAALDQLQDFHLMFILRPQLAAPSLSAPGLQKSVTIPLLDTAPGVNNLGHLDGG